MQTKRRFCLLLSLMLLCTLLPPRALSAPSLYFTAVNDRMCDLTDETMPFWQNGVLYVAGTTVDGQDLGIRYSYSREKAVATLYKGQSVLYCDLTAGTMENSRTGERYTGVPLVRYDTVFFPISVLVRIFDLKYSSTKIAYGYLLRIRDDNAILSDDSFLDAATEPIQRRYAQYERAHTPDADTSQSGTSDTTETPSHRDDLTACLLLPAEEETVFTGALAVLESYHVHATFLLTPELLEEADDAVRRAVATGNAVALRVRAGSAEEALAQAARANDALWNAASVRTRLVYPDTADQSVRDALAAAGYCPLTVDVSDFTRSGSHWADTALKWANRTGSARVYLGAADELAAHLGSALTRLRAESCAVAALNEVIA